MWTNVLVQASFPHALCKIIPFFDGTEGQISPRLVRCAERKCGDEFAFVAGTFFNHSLSLLIVNKQLRLTAKPFCAGRQHDDPVPLTPK